MEFAYDKVVYPNFCHPQTHPDRLAVVGRLFGLSPAEPDNCRVLELGCGDGSNLVPLAYQFPNSRFLGVDLAASCIEEGRKAIQSLGLSNIELVHADLSSLPASGPKFDYVISHGVYSWIPAPVRDSLLSVARGRLEPHGIVYISYNTLPGGHLRRMIWEIMRFHARDIADPEKKVEQAVAVTQLIANSIEKPDTFRQLFRDQLKQIARYGPGHLYHDDLAETNDPMYFHQFVAHAARHGLQFLGEADFFEMQDEMFTPETRQILNGLQNNRLTLEQYLDFLKCRRFRQTLLCASDIPVRYPAIVEAVRTFHIAADARRDPDFCSADKPGLVRFVEPRGGQLEVDYLPAQKAFDLLRERWPGTIPFAQLCDLVRDSVGPSPQIGGDSLESTMSEILLAAYRVGFVEFHACPVKAAAVPPPFPRAWDYARWLVARRPHATTLRGETLRIDDEAGRRLIAAMDGTRSWEALAGLMPTAENHVPIQERLVELCRLGVVATENN